MEIAILCGALVENDTPAGAAGVEVMRQLSENGKGADMFRVAWEETGQKPPAPDDVTAESERPVAEYLSRPEFELPEPEGSRAPRPWPGGSPSATAWRPRPC
ncbi:hypothetical protein ACFQXA_04700 [Nocardiopsis composta]